MAKVIWSKVAKDDLQQIYKYISRDSKYYANQVKDYWKNGTPGELPAYGQGSSRN